MRTIITSFIGIILSVLCLISMYKEFIIFQPRYYIVSGVLISVIYLIFKRTDSVNKTSDRLTIASVSTFVVLWLSSMIYHSWKMSIISPISITKIILIILLIFAFYVNLLYFRGEDSYKKKRGNQRIKQEPKKGLIEEYREKRLNKEKEQTEIILTLGVSADNEDG